MQKTSLCKRCGSPLPEEGALAGRCPRCLFEGALDSTGGIAVAGTTPDEVRQRAHPVSIGRYKILRIIGEGGMGFVYEAEQEHPRRTVALKIIKPGMANPETILRFEHEAQALGRLQHPGIAQIYEAGTADTGFGPQPYFAMELIHGLTPSEYIASRSGNIRDRLELIAKTAEAVNHAHQRGLIHRDLKPSNILVDESGQPKVLDFGVARAIDNNEAQQTRHTDVGQLVGTLAYMSPEQVLADPHEIDTRTDVYALGVLLYELMAGRLPYNTNRKLHDALEAIREEDPTMLGAVDRACKGDVETIAAKALEKDKARRYASVAELAADIRRYLTDQPIIARPPTAMYQLKKFARRNRALVAGVGAVFIVMFAGVVLSTWQAARAARAERTALYDRDRALQAESAARQQRNRAAAAEGEAKAQRNAAVEAGELAERERDRAIEAEKRARQERDRAASHNLARESVRLSTARTDDDLAALLARQAFLLQKRDPHSFHSNVVENALQQAGRVTYWSHNINRGYETQARVLAFSPDGSLLAGNGPDGSILLWDMKRPGSSPRVLKGRPGLGPVFFAAFSPDGTRVVSGGLENSGGRGNASAPAPVKIWELRESNPLPVLLHGHSREIVGGAYSPDGATLATTDSQSILLWDLRNIGNAARPLQPRRLSQAATFVAFSPDSTRLATVDSNANAEIRIFDMRNLSMPPTGLPGTRATLNMLFSPDGSRLAVGMRFGVRLLDLRNVEAPLTLYQGVASVLAFSKDGKRVAAGSMDNLIRIWDLTSSATSPTTLSGHPGGVVAVALSPDGTRLVSGGMDSAVRAWDLHLPGTVQTLLPVQGGRGASFAQTVAFAPDGNRLFAGKADGSVRMWDLKGSGTPSAVLGRDSATVGIRPVAFSPDVTRVAFGGGTNGVDIRVLDLQNPAASTAVYPIGTQITDLVFSPNGSEMAVSLRATVTGSTIELRGLRSATTRILSMPGDPQAQTRLAYSSDGTRLAAASRSEVRVWDLRNLKSSPIEFHTAQVQPVLSLAFSPDGTVLAAGTLNTVLWSLRKPSDPPVVLPSVLPRPVNALAFSPDGGRLVSANGNIQLWDLRNPNAAPIVLESTLSTLALRSVAFSPDGSRLAAGGFDGSVRLIDLGAGAADYLCARVWRNLSIDEWRLYVGEGIPYERTCPALAAVEFRAPVK